MAEECFFSDDSLAELLGHYNHVVDVTKNDSLRIDMKGNRLVNASIQNLVMLNKVLFYRHLRVQSLNDFPTTPEGLTTQLGIVISREDNQNWRLFNKIKDWGHTPTRENPAIVPIQSLTFQPEQPQTELGLGIKNLAYPILIGEFDNKRGTIYLGLKIPIIGESRPYIQTQEESLPPTLILQRNNCGLTTERAHPAIRQPNSIVGIYRIEL